MKTFVEHNQAEYQQMFEDQGWTVVTDPYEAEVVCFIGGDDVTPSMYLEQNTDSVNNEQLDCMSVGLWAQTRYHSFHVGICRGGQFLNVMEGGKMKQHINGHGLFGTHPLEYKDRLYNVTSTHHQMMIPHHALTGWRKNVWCSPDDTVEMITYNNSFCFQPHPEYYGADETRELFFEILEKEYGFS